MIDSDILVSVNIPTYNRHRELERLLESISSQATPDVIDALEINIYDNNSTDETKSVVARYYERLPRLYYICSDVNEGPFVNLHKAYRGGKAEYVWAIGDDDLLLPNALREIFSTLRLHRPDMLLTGWRRFIVDELYNVRFIDQDSSGQILFIKDIDPALVCVQVDSFVGFISANIIKRNLIHRIAPEVYTDADNTGGAGHALLFFDAIVNDYNPLLLPARKYIGQQVDNGHLSHEAWLHAHILYCNYFINYFASSKLVLRNHVVKHFHRRRLSGVIKRIISEKYRNHDCGAIISDQRITSLLSFGQIALLKAISITPSLLIRLVYNAFNTPRS